MRWMAAALLLGACSQQEAPAPQPSTVAIELPADPPAPDDPRLAKCIACHSAEMLRTQPKLSPAQWQATVAKMRDAYKAPVDPAEDAGIVAALVALQGG